VAHVIALKCKKEKEKEKNKHIYIMTKLIQNSISPTP
jgi:hypothetical protein